MDSGCPDFTSGISGPSFSPRRLVHPTDPEASAPIGRHAREGRQRRPSLCMRLKSPPPYGQTCDLCSFGKTHGAVVWASVFHPAFAVAHPQYAHSPSPALYKLRSAGLPLKEASSGSRVWLVALPAEISFEWKPRRVVRNGRS
jgi:hypothetical protein